MTKSFERYRLTIIVALCFSVTGFGQSTELTYQGQLLISSAPANGNFDFEFLLFDALGGGSQIGSAQTRNGVAVANGIFSVVLDFGTNFPGANRFLEIHVRQAGGGAFTQLTPRQPVTSAPYSVKSLSADTAINATNATTAATATNALSLGGVVASGFLQTNGNGSALTNLNASSVTTGTLANARLGLIPTANIADSAVTAPKISSGQVVKSLNTLTDNVTLTAGNNITITPAANTLTIASTSGGVGGSGTTNSIPFWNSGTTLGTSQITQNVNGVQLPNGVQLGLGSQGNQVAFGSPNGETGMTISGPAATGRADIRYDGSTLKLFNGPAGSPPSSGIAIDRQGSINISTEPGFSNIFDISAIDTRIRLQATNSIGRAMINYVTTAPGSGWFVGADTSRFFFTNNGFTALAIDTANNVGIATTAPQRLLHVNGRARIGSIPPEASVATVCFNAVGDLLNCNASSLRYKNNVNTYSDGLNILRQLRPISYNWKAGGAYDIGLGAEDVAKTSPLFASRNKDGVVEGVRYERLNMLLINAVNQQQEQIERQQTQIELQRTEIGDIKEHLNALRELVCKQNRKTAAVCRTR